VNFKNAPPKEEYFLALIDYEVITSLPDRVGLAGSPHPLAETLSSAIRRATDGSASCRWRAIRLYDPCLVGVARLDLNSIHGVYHDDPHVGSIRLTTYAPLDNNCTVPDSMILSFTLGKLNHVENMLVLAALTPLLYVFLQNPTGGPEKPTRLDYLRALAATAHAASAVALTASLVESFYTAGEATELPLRLTLLVSIAAVVLDAAAAPLYAGNNEDRKRRLARPVLAALCVAYIVLATRNTLLEAPFTAASLSGATGVALLPYSLAALVYAIDSRERLYYLTEAMGIVSLGAALLGLTLVASIYPSTMTQPVLAAYTLSYIALVYMARGTRLELEQAD